MYVCRECGGLFKNPHVIRDGFVEHFGTPCYTTICVSPCCQSDYIQAKQCDNCDGEITAQYISLEDGRILCPECFVLRDLRDE